MSAQLVKNNPNKLRSAVFLAILFIVITILWIAISFDSAEKIISSAEIQEHSNTPLPSKSDAKISGLDKKTDSPDIKLQVAQFAEKLHAIQSPETEQLMSKGDALVKDADHVLLKMVAKKESPNDQNSKSPVTSK